MGLIKQIELLSGRELGQLSAIALPLIILLAGYQLQLPQNISGAVESALANTAKNAEQIVEDKTSYSIPISLTVDELKTLLEAASEDEDLEVFFPQSGSVRAYKVTFTNNFDGNGEGTTNYDIVDAATGIPTVRFKARINNETLQIYGPIDMTPGPTKIIPEMTSVISGNTVLPAFQIVEPQH